MCVQRKACMHLYIVILLKCVDTLCTYCQYQDAVIYTFIHLKVGFQTPEPALDGRRDFSRRRTDSRKKPTLTPPRMTTPEIRALVTGFISWEGSPEAGGWDGEEKQKLETDMFFDMSLT